MVSVGADSLTSLRWGPTSAIELALTSACYKAHVVDHAVNAVSDNVGSEILVAAEGICSGITPTGVSCEWAGPDCMIDRVAAVCSV